MRHLQCALGFLTRFPLPRSAPPTEEDLAAAAGWFPLAGAAVGAAAALVFLAGWVLFGPLPLPLPAAALAVAAGVLATGALHLDALADTADGLGCGGERERMLAVMRDARVGAHGAAAIALDLLLRVAFLAALGPAAPAAAPAAAALGRWAMVLAMPLYPYARAGPGLGRTFAGRVGRRQVALATVLAGTLALVPALAVAGHGRTPVLAPLVALAVAAAAGLAVARWAARRLGGLTGDVYGAINEVAELHALAVFLFFVR